MEAVGRPTSIKSITRYRQVKAVDSGLIAGNGSMENHGTPAENLFRTRAKYPVLIAWTLVSGSLYILLLLSLSDRSWALHSSIVYGLGVALFLLGPVYLAYYLFRRHRDYILIDDAAGLRLRGRDLIEWDQILAVEVVPGLLGLGTQRDPVKLSIAGGELRPSTFAQAVKSASQGPRSNSVGPVLVCLLLSVVALFPPWHARVILTVRGRGQLAFHELERDIDFCLRCAPHLRENKKTS